ncbi:hypothetical protein BC749_101130 [Flavobacterium araucananum]|nr:hypothetical protein BC749_101130 [Flavobacterium araucananum]
MIKKNIFNLSLKNKYFKELTLLTGFKKISIFIKN